MYLIFPAALGLGVSSACNRNESQKYKNNNVSGSKVRLVPPSLSRLSRQRGSFNISQHYRPLTGIALLYGDVVCFLSGTNWTVSTATSIQYLAVNCEPIV
jgi:hypothetical protein